MPTRSAEGCPATPVTWLCSGATVRWTACCLGCPRAWREPRLSRSKEDRVRARAAAVLAALLAAATLILGWGAGPASASTSGPVLFGTVTSGDKGVAGVKISASNDSGFSGEATTDAAGAWEIKTPESGTYTVVLDEATLPDGVALTADSGNTRTVNAFLGKVRIQFPTGESTVQTTSKAEQAVQLTVDGLLLGLILALAAVGLSLIYGTTGLTNFAHGELVTVGALAAYFYSAVLQHPVHPVGAARPHHLRGARRPAGQDPLEAAATARHRPHRDAGRVDRPRDLRPLPLPVLLRRRHAAVPRVQRAGGLPVRTAVDHTQGDHRRDRRDHGDPGHDLLAAAHADGQGEPCGRRTTPPSPRRPGSTSSASSTRSGSSAPRSPHWPASSSASPRASRGTSGQQILLLIFAAVTVGGLGTAFGALLGSHHRRPADPALDTGHPARAQERRRAGHPDRHPARAAAGPARATRADRVRERVMDWNSHLQPDPDAGDRRLRRHLLPRRDRPQRALRLHRPAELRPGGLPRRRGVRPRGQRREHGPGASGSAWWSASSRRWSWRCSSASRR